jgi:hypothetical protein
VNTIEAAQIAPKVSAGIAPATATAAASIVCRTGRKPGNSMGTLRKPFSVV